MKLASAALLLLAPLTVATPSPSFLDVQSPIKAKDQGPPVNGDNPLSYCGDPSTYILQIDTVNLKPNPPEAGQTLVISADGYVRETVEPGAKILLTVKYGMITILNGEVNLCDQLKEVGLTCPVEAGYLDLTKTVDMPQHIPPGQYSVHADVYTKDGVRITCLEANNIRFE